MPTLNQILARERPSGTLLASTSLFANAKATTVERVCPLIEILTAIRDGEWSPQIARARKAVAEGKKDHYEWLKKKLPGFTISAALRSRAQDVADRVIAHTGWMQADFDAKDNPDMIQSAARAKLMADPHVGAVFVGPSGAGIKALVRIDPDQHTASAVAAAAYFKEQHGLTLNPSCKDITRLCFVSHDPELWIREDAATVLPVPEKAQESKALTPHSNGKTPASHPNGNHPSIDEIRNALSHIRIRPDYDPWIKIVSAVGSELSDDDTIRVLTEWRPEEKPGEYADKLHHKLQRVKIGTLFHIAKQHGYNPREALARKLKLKFNGGESANEGSSPDRQELPCIRLPAKGRKDSEFASEMADVIAPLHIWFRKAERIVAVRTMQHSEKVRSLGFYPMEPLEARTAVEDHLQTGTLSAVDGEPIFTPRTMPAKCAAGMLAAPQFKRKLPEIIRILDLPIPILLSNGTIALPKSGYDPRFRTYTNPNAPQLHRMDLREALGWIRQTQLGFGFINKQSCAHSIARLITPACRGLMGWEARFPLWHFSGNRPRAGKDYLAGIAQLLYEGRTIEDSPLEQSSEETRKRITAALMSGRRMMHFANCQGHMRDACFCGAVTSKTFGARNLGSTDASSDLNLPNEIEFSMSANIGMTFREDFEPRTRRIALEFSEDNANSREFPVPDLHGWILENRADILSAIVSLVVLWHEAGAPHGPTRFNSFPEWGNVVGGIMTACDLYDPCLPHIDDGGLPMNPQETAMRALFAAAYEQYPEQWIQKKDIYAIIEAHSEDDDFNWFSDTWKNKQSDPGETARVGKALRRFKGRELDGITLRINDRNAKSQQHRFQFTKENDSPSIVLADFLPASLVLH